MKKIMVSTSVISAAAAAACSFLYIFFDAGAFLSLAITAGTIAYHFIMRLFTGAAVGTAVRKGINSESAWFRERAFEKKLCRFLKVRKWKKYMPTYDEREFSFAENSLKDIIQATCRSEVVHEVIAVLSFLPLLAVPIFGDIEVFLITSAAAAVIDLSFVLLQRYNRPRLIAMAKRKGEL